MAIRARLTAPPAAPQEGLPQLAPHWTSVPARVLLLGDRRMEAETYLSSGYGLRIAMEAHTEWRPLRDFARVWQPSRLKGILVSAGVGTPFLAATQVFDIRPVPRKWLALARTDNAADRFVAAGTIVVTCSGAVGRATLAHAPHANTLVSHDLLRVTPRDQEQWGWVYAYLRSSQARAMMSGAQYGHIIKHLEVSHLDALPVPNVPAEIAFAFQNRVQDILVMRDEAHRLTLEAESRFAREVGEIDVTDWGESGFVERGANFAAGRRRLDASAHNPGARAIQRHLANRGAGTATIADAGFRVWVPGRYKRIPAEDGVVYYDSADLLETNPDTSKRFADCGFGDEHGGRVDRNWLLMPCSGQVYGIIGTAVLAGASLDGQVVSNHVMRLAPEPDAAIRAGYLITALTHPVYGRPLVKALAFGSSVPELDPAEVRDLRVVRLSKDDEDAIAELAEESAARRAEADVLERQLGDEASRLVDRFLAGEVIAFQPTMAPVTHIDAARSSPALHEHMRVRLLRPLPDACLRSGVTGTVVHIYRGGLGYEVEFVIEGTRSVVVTLKSTDVEGIAE